MLNVKGLVLDQRMLGEQDRSIDVLTAEYGVINIIVKGAAKLSSKTGSATQLFAYSQFSLAERKGRGGARILGSVAPIHIFYGLRSSVTAVALASYMAQAAKMAVLPRSGVPEMLRLLLNSFHYLSERTYPEAHVKAVFELRAAALLGFLPDVVMCRVCGQYLPAKLCFFIEDGSFLCAEHLKEGELRHYVTMPAGTLLAIRHIVLREPERIFSFKIAPHCEAPLAAFAEQFLRYHIDCELPALGYYRQIVDSLTPHP